MSNWTPEPWKVADYALTGVKHCIYENVDTPNYLIADTQTGLQKNVEAEANAQRIVTCVNLCANLTESEIKEAIEMWKACR